MPWVAVCGRFEDFHLFALQRHSADPTVRIRREVSGEVWPGVQLPAPYTVVQVENRTSVRGGNLVSVLA